MTFQIPIVHSICNVNNISKDWQKQQQTYNLLLWIFDLDIETALGFDRFEHSFETGEWLVVWHAGLLFEVIVLLAMKNGIELQLLQLIEGQIFDVDLKGFDVTVFL